MVGGSASTVLGSSGLRGGDRKGRGGSAGRGGRTWEGLKGKE